MLTFVYHCLFTSEVGPDSEHVGHIWDIIDIEALGDLYGLGDGHVVSIEFVHLLVPIKHIREAIVSNESPIPVDKRLNEVILEVFGAIWNLVNI